MPPSQRLIRRQSLAQRLSSYPQDLLLSLNETYELLEWDSLSDTLSIPIGVALNAVYILARLDQHDYVSAYHEKDVFQGSHIHDSSGIFGGGNSGFRTLLYLVSWCLVGFSIANTVYCFTKRKNYRMFNAKPNTEPMTPNARRVTIDSPVTYSPGFFSSLTQTFRPATPTFAEDGGKGQAWELSIWDPTISSLNTFCWFSPLHVLIIEYVAKTSIFATICILILNTAQLSLLISHATTQQKDKTTLYTQVLSEYNTKFIEPRISVRKRDIGTSTPTTMSPDASPQSDSNAGTVEAAMPSYGASGASLANFRRKYGPVEHTPIRMKHSVSVGTDLLSPAPSVSRPGLKNSATSSFDLWNAGGNDFPSPVKNSRREGSPMKTMSKSTSTPAFARPASRGPTFVNNSPVKPAKRYSGGDGERDGVPGIRRW